MSNAISLGEYEKKWEALLAMGRQACHDADSCGRTDEDEDPFNCDNMAILSTRAAAENTMHEFVQKWRDLDSRKVSNQRRPHWYEHHVRLPQGFSFDQPPPADAADDANDEDCIVSLENPMETTSYAKELWELFQMIPTADQIRTDAEADHSLPSVETAWKNISDPGSADRLYATERLRQSNIHDPLPAREGAEDSVSTIRFEFLRDTPGRGYRPDPNRMVLEFASYHTLYDVHTSVCELDPDICWDEVQEQNQNSPDQNEDTETATPDSPSGFFFIEGDFYVSGTADYTTTIFEWLNNSGPRSELVRKRYLGLERKPNVYAMATASLSQLPCRIGVRYSHLRNGAAETTLFVTDLRCQVRCSSFPILHDVCTVPLLPTCDACQGKTATLVSSTSCKATGGHRVLCWGCAKTLRLPKHELRSYKAWRSEGDRVNG